MAKHEPHFILRECAKVKLCNSTIGHYGLGVNYEPCTRELSPGILTGYPDTQKVHYHIQFTDLKFNTSSQIQYTPRCMLHSLVLYNLLLAVNMSVSLSLAIPAVSLPLVLSKHCQLSPPGHHSYVGRAGDCIPVSPVLFIFISTLYSVVFCRRNF